MNGTGFITGSVIKPVEWNLSIKSHMRNFKEFLKSVEITKIYYWLIYIYVNWYYLLIYVIALVFHLFYFIFRSKTIQFI